MSMRRSSTRVWIVLPLSAAVWLFAFSLPAVADEGPRFLRTCKKLDKQIAHFQGVAEMAQDRRDYRWFDATQDHIKRLESRRPRICPEQVAEENSRYFRIGAKAARDLVKLASDAAIRYFTGGLY